MSTLHNMAAIVAAFAGNTFWQGVTFTVIALIMWACLPRNNRS